MRKDVWEDLINRIDKLTEKVDAITASIHKEDDYFLKENEFVFSMSAFDIMNKRINIFRNGTNIGSMPIDEAFKYLNNEIEIIENTNYKTNRVIISKDYINSLIIRELKNDYMKLGYELTDTLINYNTVETVDNSYLDNVDIVVSFKKIEK